MDKIVDKKEKAPEQRIGELLNEKGWHLATAESCTGGTIAAMITAWPGCSNYYKGSVVAYDNDVKKNVLGVSVKDLEEHGAVSQPVVEQMVQGAIRVLGAGCAVATSGIAGPGGGTPDKPVGTVWIAAGTKDRIISRCYRFGTERKENILRASRTALQMLLKVLQN
ncbi:MAG: CinA family protein [Tannerellaceae bacterium]|nr:CinA family protein [Tannerellaceae bacterium]MCD8176950.1 CinA family protein [Tannerellaceae bacterium]